MRKMVRIGGQNSKRKLHHQSYRLYRFDYSPLSFLLYPSIFILALQAAYYHYQTDGKRAGQIHKFPPAYSVYVIFSSLC